MKVLLVDNGSLRPDSVLNLRHVAMALSEQEQMEVLPASLLHSSKVPAEQLGGEPAVNLERRLRWCLESGIREFLVVPFFFGPTRAILEYLPQRVAHLAKKFGSFTINRTPFLYEDDDPSDNVELVSILADNVRHIIEGNNLARPRVALVDHGSPVEAVTGVRNSLAVQLARELEDDAACVAPASMERRAGDAYAFNEPLLERLLVRKEWHGADVVVSMLFLSPGRHAGPDGDIANICREAAARAPGQRTFMTPLVASHPLILKLLARRLRDGPLPLE